MDQNVRQAINTTLKMLTAEDISTPNAWNGDLATMQGILVAVVQGQWELKPVEGAAPPAEPPTPPITPPDDGKGKKH